MAQQPAPGKQLLIADDDPSVCDALSALFSLTGFRVSSFVDGSSFLAAAREHIPDCAILDLYMPGRSGLDILKELIAQNYPAPIIIMSGKADISTAVAAIKNGAADFVEKPFDPSQFVTNVHKAIETWASRGIAGETPNNFSDDFPGNELLTPRERQVLAQIVSGASSKMAAQHFGISPRTVEVYRARTMEKLGARNTADLIRIALSTRRRLRTVPVAPGHKRAPKM